MTNERVCVEDVCDALITAVQSLTDVVKRLSDAVEDIRGCGCWREGVLSCLCDDD